MKTFVAYSFYFLIYVTLTTAYTDITSNYLKQNNVVKLADGDLYLILDKLVLSGGNKVYIKLYYESHCPACREFVSTDFKQTVEKLNKYLDIKTYPYGKAKTHTNGNEIEFVCQHGPNECYGNKLHACALDTITNYTTALLFNSCMMDKSQDEKGSDDKAADKCGFNMKIDPSPIKVCAKGNKGSELLKYYGEESKKADFHYVPYVLINGAEYNGNDNFIKDVCARFSDPLPPCNLV